MAPENAPKDITRMLADLQRGQSEVESELLRIVYNELKRIARRHMSKERPDHTLQATALVNEAYVRLVASADRDWKNRQHFFRVASEVMRTVLVDYARSRYCAKRGGARKRIDLNESLLLVHSENPELLEIDRALLKLQERSPLQSRIVELRFFAGMTEDEIGVVVNLDARSVRRHWATARAFLHGELSSTAI